MKITPQNISIEDLEEETGLSVDEWHGKCTLISNAAARLIGDGCHAVYGHYIGDVDPFGFWGERAGNGFIQHGWVLLDNGLVLDPTRWSFEGVEPYIFLGSSEDYDEGGNVWRQKMAKACPQDPGKELPFEMSEEEKIFVRIFVDTPQVGMNHLFWMANLPYDEIGDRVGELYSFLDSHDLRGLVPFDNFERARREGF